MELTKAVILLQAQAVKLEAQARRSLIETTEAYQRFTSYQKALEDVGVISTDASWEIYQTFTTAILGLRKEEVKEAQKTIQEWRV